MGKRASQGKLIPEQAEKVLKERHPRTAMRNSGWGACLRAAAACCGLHSAKAEGEKSQLTDRGVWADNTSAERRCAASEMSLRHERRCAGGGCQGRQRIDGGPHHTS